MKRRYKTIGCGALTAVLLAALGASAATLGTAFPYQGRLTAGGAPAQGMFDLKLILYNATVGGAPVGPVLTNENVVVSNGLFTTIVDFGPGIFNGDTYWMEVAVRPGASGGAFGAPLLPRQPIIATPYAMHAGNAEQVNGLSSDAFWKLGGNADTLAGTDFVGTTDRVDLEFRVGNERALLLAPTPSVPNIVAGSVNNTITSGAVGAGIGGGDNNAIGGDFASIGGGEGNVISNTGNYGVIPGGQDGAVFNYGQQAFASGSFSAVGDAQSSVYVLRGKTTAAIPISELFLDGSGERIGVPRNSAWAFDVLVVASGANNDAGGFQVKGVIKNVAGATSMVGSSSTLSAVPIATDVTSWFVLVRADNANDALTITVDTPGSAQEVRWVATVRTVEIAF